MWVDYSSAELGHLDRSVHEDVSPFDRRGLLRHNRASPYRCLEIQDRGNASRLLLLEFQGHGHRSSRFLPVVCVFLELGDIPRVSARRFHCEILARRYTKTSSLSSLLPSSFYGSITLAFNLASSLVAYKFFANPGFSLPHVLPIWSSCDFHYPTF